MTLPHGDPVAAELTLAIHGGDLDTLQRLISEWPELATVRQPIAELAELLVDLLLQKLAGQPLRHSYQLPVRFLPGDLYD